MKIIKAGEWKQRITCRGCSSVLEYSIPDIEFEETMQEDESFAMSYFVTCPVCSRKIMQNSIPELIKQEVSNKE